MTPSPESERIDAGRFWTLYYSGRIVRMRRRAGSGVAGAYDHYDKGMILPEERAFACSHEALAAYDYADWKFSAPVSSNFAVCMANIIESPAMAKETAVHGQQLDLAAELAGVARLRGNQGYSAWRAFLAGRLRRTELRLEGIEPEFSRRAPSKANADLYDRLGDTRYLGLDRQLPLKAIGFLTTSDRAVDFAAGVLENSYEDLDTQRIAIWALGRHNHKGAIGLLMTLLNSPAAANLSVPIERALQFLCSGEELLPVQYENEAAFWSRVIAAQPSSPAGFIEQDAASVFWEKRLRAAINPALDPRSRLLLQADEVPAVRAAARQA